MNNIDWLNEIKKGTAHIKCSEHNKAAEFYLEHEKISANFCCEKFGEESKKRVSEITKSYITKILNEKVKSIFKK